MSGEQLTSRFWFVDLAVDEARLRCSFQRQGKRVVRFTVQLEIFHQDQWRPIVRYDNAHGFCHRDTLHPDGTQDKTGVYIGDVNETFTFAIEDLRTNWETHRSRYREEMES
ncbi:MAG TPA: hypothetical protein VE999_19110 [Gemmataceae bacterium]|nr:hypothetical protein [Gemmataceae bacterium]